MHVHFGPDTFLERRVDALQAALQAQEAGMQAIVLKSHNYPTTPIAYTVSQIAKNVHVYGSLTLDFENGGLNIHAVEASARLGAKVVWMPTLSSANDRKKLNLPGAGIYILDDDDRVVPQVQGIMEVIKTRNLVLATGHLSVKEALILVDEAKKMGLPKVVVTHPLETRVGATLSLDEQKQVTARGAIIEHCFLGCMPTSERLDPRAIVEAIRAVGVESCFLSTDFGQAFNPPPAEGMRMMIGTMLRVGMTREEIEILVKRNPARLLDLDW